MKIKNILGLILAFALAAAVVSAADIAYITLSPSTVVDKYIEVASSLNLTTDVIDDSNITSTNFSKYRMIIVGDGNLANYQSIPVNSIPSLVLTTNANVISAFNWSTSVSSTTVTGWVSVYTSNTSHFITNGFPTTFNDYTTSTGGSHGHKYLPTPPSRSRNITTILSNNGLNTEQVLGIVEENKKVLNNVVTKAKGVYFGINEVNIWSSYSETAFRNSITWLLTDFNSPVISNITVSSLTNNSAIVSWNTDKNSNMTFSYGKDVSLANSIRNVTYSTSHSVPLTGLEQFTTYYYQIKACNQNNYCGVSSVGSFTTLDKIAPELLSASASNLTNSSATISANSNENSNYTVYYGTNAAAMNAKATKAGFTTSASIQLSGLSEKTTYYYLVNLCDAYSNCKNSSVFSFTTTDLTAPNRPNNVMLEVNNTNNNIKVKWDAPSGEVPANYRVYISETYNGFNFAAANATVTSTEFVDSTAASARERYYVVRSVDSSNNEDTNQLTVGKFDLDLSAGYNLVSFSVMPFDSSIAKVMHQDANYHPVTEIKTYNATTGGLRTSRYQSGSWTVNEFSAMTEMNGYILKSDYNTKLTIVGNAAWGTTHSLKQGMNLVGLSMHNSKSIYDAIAQSPADYSILEISSRKVDGYYNLAAYYPSSSTWVLNGDSSASLFSIEPGKAYWLKSNKDVSLVVSQ
jgi:hypothetical protein